MIKGDQIVPYSALFIDMQYRHLFNTLWTYLKPVDQNKQIQEIEEIWLGGLKIKKSQSHYVLELPQIQFYNIKGLNWPSGSELILTGINIPDMIQVLRLNSIIPVPVEVNPDTLGCTLDQFKQFYTEKKGIMISYVFGAKFDASEIIDWAKSKGLFIMEDEAENFVAPNAKLNPNVDFSTYSFGSIKTCSAFVGSISVIRNNEALYRKMKALQESYPKWSQRNCFKRTLKNLIPMIVKKQIEVRDGSLLIFFQIGTIKNLLQIAQEVFKRIHQIFFKPIDLEYLTLCQ